MKKLGMLYLAGMFGILQANAQMYKSDIFLGGSIGSTVYNIGTSTYNYDAGNTRTNQIKNYNLSLSPTVGFFVNNSLVVGTILNLSYSINTNNTRNTTLDPLINYNTVNSNTFSLVPFLRYYFYTTGHNNTFLFAQLEAGGGVGGGNNTQSVYYKNNSGYQTNGNTNSLFVIKSATRLGITHLVQPNIGFDLSLGISHDYQKSNFTQYTESISTSGKLSNSTINYKSNEPQTGFTLSAGFHFFY